MASSSHEKVNDLITRLEAMSAKDRDRISQKNVRRSAAEHQHFQAAFTAGECYVCGKPLLTFSQKSPCLHWLLKPKGFKKNHLPAVAEQFGFFQIQSYLRWVANTDGFAKNINDLAEEGTGTKLVELTIRYRHLEWAFSCAESDYRGHQTSQHAAEPHYHFQMRIDRRPFINYNDFHLPFSERDIFDLEARRRLPHIVKHKFPRGEGMADVLNDETVEALITHGISTRDENEASLKLDTMIMADEGTTISGDDLHDLFQEAKRTGVTASSLMHKLPNARVRVYVTPGPGVVEQAPRSGRKKNA